MQVSNVEMCQAEEQQKSDRVWKEEIVFKDASGSSAVTRIKTRSKEGPNLELSERKLRT